MNCIICKAPSKRQPLSDDAHRVECPRCGNYRVTNEACTRLDRKAKEVLKFLAYSWSKDYDEFQSFRLSFLGSVLWKSSWNNVDLFNEGSALVIFDDFYGRCIAEGMGSCVKNG